MIVAGELTGGSKLVVKALEARLGLSATPIKSALLALERDGFISYWPQRGFSVLCVSAEDMADIYELREAIEGQAARRLADSADRLGVVGDLIELLDRQSRHAMEDDLLRYGDVDIEFHRLIWTAAGNRRLSGIADNLIGQHRMGTAFTSLVRGRVGLALAEHERIVDAIRIGDGQQAEQLSRDHVRLAAASYLNGSANDGCPHIGR